MKPLRIAGSLALACLVMCGPVHAQTPPASPSVEVSIVQATPGTEPTPPPTTLPPPTVVGLPLAGRPQLADPTLWGGSTGPAVPGSWNVAPIGEDVYPGIDNPRFYVGVEYLLWWVKNEQLPPLVTTSPAASNGIIGMPGTTILYGAQAINEGAYSGLRYTTGWWFGEDRATALEFGGFFLGQRSAQFSTNSNSFPVIARPFFNVNTGAEFSEIVASPGLSTGSISVAAPTRLWGMEVDLRRQVYSGGVFRMDLLGGFRFVDLEEGLLIQENVNALPGVLGPAAVQAVAIDSFHTHNQFYGGQAGTRMEFHLARWYLDMQGKVALGSMSQTVTVQGAQLLTPVGGTPMASTGGLLALPSNIGDFHRDRFAAVPEVNVNVGFFAARWCKIFIGYSFLYASSVARPADQVDRSLNVTQIPNFNFPNPPPGPIRPIMPFNHTDFWAQGINFGCEFRY
jgi:hypothetical protein